MAKSVAEADKKSINLAQEIYVHYHKQNYLDYRKKYNYEIDISESLASIYNKNAKEIRKQMSALKNLSNKDGQTVVDALGLMNDVNGNSSVYAEMNEQIIMNVTEKIRQGIQRSVGTSAAIKQTTSIDKEIKLLDDYIKYIKDTISAFEKGNEDFFSYLLSKYQNNTNVLNNVNNLFSVGNSLSLLAINKTALTSFDSLKQRVVQLENAKKSLKANGKNETLNYKGKTVSYSSFIYPMHQLFINILGGIGEGFGATYALKTLEDFLKTLESDNMKVTVEGTGTEKTAEGMTKKADYSITINNETGEMSLSFGISAKAQALKKGKKVTTTFETTKLKNLLNKYIILNNIEYYIFYNNLYNNMLSNAEMQYLRRKIAAQAMLDAVTGKGQGENVLFLQYLDELVSVDDFFESLSHSPQNRLPTISITGVSKIKSNNNFITRRGKQLNILLQQEEYKDLTPEDKSIVAWIRSRQVIKAMNELTTQIQYVH